MCVDFLHFEDILCGYSVTAGAVFCGLHNQSLVLCDFHAVIQEQGFYFTEIFG